MSDCRALRRGAALVPTRLQPNPTDEGSAIVGPHGSGRPRRCQGPNLPRVPFPLRESGRQPRSSQTGGAVRSSALQQHLATLDHSKKAVPHLSNPPDRLVGGTPEGQALAKGTLKAAAEAKLAPEMVQAIAKQQGRKSPETLVDTLAAIESQPGLVRRSLNQGQQRSQPLKRALTLLQSGPGRASS